MTMRSHRGLAVGLLFLTTATACGDSLLDVTNPSSVQESDLGNPALARTRSRSRRTSCGTPSTRPWTAGAEGNHHDREIL